MTDPNLNVSKMQCLQSNNDDAAPINKSPLQTPSTNSYASAERIFYNSKSLKSPPFKFNKPCTNSVPSHAPVSVKGKRVGWEKKEFNLKKAHGKGLCSKNAPKQNMYYDQQKINELVNATENDESVPSSRSSVRSICEVIDLSNPFGLDFQGMDYKNTYERDEQLLINQNLYRKVERFQQRRNTQKETILNVEAEQQRERVAIPKHFVVQGPVQPKEDDFLSNIMSKNGHLLKTLVRADQKPDVIKTLKEEDERRRERYKQLYLKKQEKLAKEEEIRVKNKAAEENSTVLAKKDIDDLMNSLVKNLETKKVGDRIISEPKKYPHNMQETKKFRCDMKKSRNDLINRAKVIQKFYEEKSINKKIPKNLLEISSDSCSVKTVSSKDQSTNDEDDLVVGKKGSKFLLRGFCFKQGTHIRGKWHQHEVLPTGKKTKGCATRTEWFESLVSKRDPRQNIINHQGLKLFPQKVGLKVLNAKSAIRQYRKNSSAINYHRRPFKKVHVKKPKTIKVKKFNLISYMYGNTTKKKSKSHSDLDNNLHDPTMDFIKNIAEKEKENKKLQKFRRMRYLGKSIIQRQSSKSKSLCVDSTSDDSEWVPEENNQQIETIRLDIQERANMPAPDYRETTLRQNPRRPRDYKNLRVPSPLLEEFLQNNHIPLLKTPKEDKKIGQNIRTVKNTEFANKFHARHHHDHWDAAQHKTLYVPYSRKIIKPKLLEENEFGKKRSNVTLTTFKSHPREWITSNVDFSRPKPNIDQMIQEKGKKPKVFDKQSQVFQVRKSKDIPLHSRSVDEGQEYPGRQKFIEFIGEIKTVLNKRSQINETELGMTKDNFIQELQEDFDSIESCLSSLSSSECTSLSLNSGSFLRDGETKIPLDYIRKALVPFEELKRNRIEAVPIEKTKKDINPYQIVPFAGQKNEQLNHPSGKDTFFTFNTRLQDGLRQRLNLETENKTKDKLIGTKKTTKAIAQVATDIDELYIEDLKQIPSLRLFKWNSSRTVIKDALRKKFESLLIQGEIVRTKIKDRRNEEYYDQIMKSKDMFEKLFAKWEKREYETAMEVVNKIKPYYEATDVYRKQYQELNKQFTILNMDIVYIENQWTSRTIFQNFHYLLASMDWRIEHDWIHRSLDGSLESFQESIAKRYKVNIRQRDKDDAWAVKEYYEKIFLKNPHPIILVFKNANEFNNGVENLRSKTFVLLKELHYTLGILAELKQKYKELKDWCTIELESRKRIAQNKCAHKYNIEKRAELLKGQVNFLLGDPIIETFSDKLLSHMKGIINEVYKDVVPMTYQKDLNTLEQIAAVSLIVNKLFGELEKISPNERIRVEKRHRRLNVYYSNISKQAVFIERRIESELVKVQHNLAPPFQKPKRQGKLPRSEIKKTKSTKKATSLMTTEQNKMFYKALHDKKGRRDISADVQKVDGIQQQIVPFYFDHFLIINGYQPNYDFRTQIEIADGPEIDRMQIKKVLPEVLEKFDKWQETKQRTMEEHISQNPEMYQNVQI